MGVYSVSDSAAHGTAAIVLSDHGADLHAAFVPSLGMIGCSLLHRGTELLGQRRGLQQYAATGSTMGIPFLHPWANRLSSLEYGVAGRRVVLDPTSPRLHRDANGLPIHGLLAASPHWRVIERAAHASGAQLTAELDFGADADLLAAFPFPHRLTLSATLRAATLHIDTTLQATGDVAVPVSFGYHPYLQLPSSARAEWQLDAPVRRRAILDERGIPTGERELYRMAGEALGTRSFDDLFTELERPTRFLLRGGGRRVTVTFHYGYPCAQIYAPANEAFICIEPMTAPTNALISGDGLRLLEPGATFTARFTIAVGHA
jgi:galactose mutarotase-like enzyme